MIDVPIRVKDALRDGRHLKNYRIEILPTDGNDDGFTIENDNLVSESVSFDERMCSEDVLKFGLTEGTSLEFQYFGFGNIRGRRIQAFIEVQYVDADKELQWHTIPMGFFTVMKCSRQVSTGIFKVTAYNKLMSDYLDAKANTLLAESYSQDYTLKVYDIMKTMLSDYQIAKERVPVDRDNPGPYFPETIPSNSVSLGNFRFPITYGQNSPLNAYEVDVAANEQFNITIIANAPNYRLVNGYFELDTIAGTMEGFERNVAQYIKDLFDNSDIEFVGKTGSVGDAVIDTICKNGGFSRICGVSVQEDSFTYGHYSTIDYEHGVAGARPIRDIVNRAVNAINGIFNLSIKLPSVIYTATGLMIDFRGYIFDRYLRPDSSLYNYYDENNILQSDYWHPLKLSNGDDYTDDIYTIRLYQVQLTEAEAIEFKISDMPDFTLRELVTAAYETVCQYGQLDRETDLFYGKELSGDGLYPADSLYPDDALYPSEGNERSVKSLYSRLWTDNVGTQTFRYLIITYKAIENGNEVEKTLQRTVDENGTTDYNMSDNWLFKNLIWTDQEVGDYADSMVGKLRIIKWFPFEMWCAGLPYLETGDKIEIVTPDGTETSYVLQRQLDGIQNLQDTYINGELDVF